MVNGMIQAVKGCLKEEMRMDVIANNLANVGVLGYKKTRISFQDTMNMINGTSARAGKAGDIPADPALVRTRIDFDQGNVRTTGNPLDFTIYGKGFFKVMTPEGIRYTRKGNFTLDPAGVLITQEGHQVMGKGGPITISGADISVNNQGSITVDGGEVGQLDLVDFKDPQSLMKEGNGLLKDYSNSGEIAPPPESIIRQGYVEMANVNVAEEMVQMIHCLRAFESYQKVIQVLDGIDNRVINEVSRLR